MRKEMYTENRELKEVKIADLTPRTRSFKVTFKVLSVGEERSVMSRRDGMEHRVADVLVGDETGTVIFSAWDSDIERMKDLVGETVTLKNGYVSLFRGSLRLGLGRYGSIEPANENIDNVNAENNVSEKEFPQDTKYRRYRKY